jgi:polyhydroxybutyrate depolymerase
MLKTILTILLGIAALVLLISLFVFVLYKLLNRTNGTIQSSGEKRKYLLYVPKSYDPARPTPLVISMHGFIEWPAHQMEISHWNKLADENGFIVVYPSGTGFPLRWGTLPRAGGENRGGRDVTFISDLIDKLEQDYHIDPARIYANGLSNGGGMAFLLACKLADRIAAVGGVAGAYSTPWSECSPSRPVPVIAFHGDADPIVPYGGAVRPTSKFVLPPIADWVARWAQHNGCTSPPVALPASGEVSGVRYTGCAQNAGVDFYTIHAGGHSWPGGKGLPKFIVGNTSQDIDATRVMWDFFLDHPLAVTGTN